ncbi:MAG: thiamine pyrophosphate-binding protein [Thermoplasmataceae archaeon]
MSNARRILEILFDRGVDRIFMVSGTDHAAFIEEAASGGRIPEIIVIPHEITAASAAYGYSLAGKIGTVFVHTTPGTANTTGVMMDALSSRTPLVVIAGRTPYTEAGSTASRNRRIHWAQEARDQGEMVRQWCKWDFEIRTGDQISTALNRAIDIALTEPMGPVYLTVPREVTVQ